jgi:hypothetical protein
MPDRLETNSGNSLSFAALHDEAGGILQLHVIPPSVCRRIFEASGDGDGHAFRLASGLMQSIDRIRTAPAGQAMLCMTCPSPLCADHALSFVLCVDHVAQPRIGMGAALCPESGARPDRHERVTDALRKVWPELRLIQIHAYARHA